MVEVQASIILLSNSLLGLKPQWPFSWENFCLSLTMLYNSSTCCFFLRLSLLSSATSRALSSSSWSQTSRERRALLNIRSSPSVTVSISLTAYFTTSAVRLQPSRGATRRLASSVSVMFFVESITSSKGISDQTCYWLLEAEQDRKICY